MQLKDHKGTVWHVHFHHRVGQDRRKVVECSVHQGPCMLTHQEPKYCINGTVGQTACSHSDKFRGGVGHKIALERALSKFSRELRAALWDSYWALPGNRKPAPQQPEGLDGSQKRRVLQLADKWEQMGLSLFAKELRTVLGVRK